MTRKEFTNAMLENKINYVAIIRVPDWNGGFGYRAILNSPDYELGEFEYVEWEGDASKAAAHHSMPFYGHREPFHEKPFDFLAGQLSDLVMEELHI